MAEGYLPSELWERLAGAEEKLQANDDGHLPLGERRRVRATFGDEGGGPEDRTPGHRRRFALNRDCVHRVMPVWRAARPDDDRPARMVELAEQLMNGQLSADEVRAEEDRFAVDLMELAADIGGWVNAAGEASVDLISTATVGDYGDDTPMEVDDHELDPDQLEAGFLGSIAVASYPGASDDDVEARRAYWRWYLEEAVPAAYRAVDDN
ncbi:MAG: Imm5 family immunity protein [Actinomycetota bacterium]|nr:Imm5 family immunity protein [Actinomycetota bacterium]